MELGCGADTQMGLRLHTQEQLMSQVQQSFSSLHTSVKAKTGAATTVIAAESGFLKSHYSLQPRSPHLYLRQ